MDTGRRVGGGGGGGEGERNRGESLPEKMEKLSGKSRSSEKNFILLSLSPSLSPSGKPPDTAGQGQTTLREGERES